MAIFNSANLALDIKAQDRLREFFSKRGTSENITFTCVALGDSDVDYEMSQQVSRIKVLNAPYQVPRIKHKLIYSGVQTNLTGKITAFTREVTTNGLIFSYYDYPQNLTPTVGQIPPTLSNGFDISTIFFSPGTTGVKAGFIVYFQTLPDGFLDTNGIQERLKEKYTFITDNIPTGWEIIIDEVNGSLLIAKPASYTFTGGQSSIVISGTISGISRTIFYNT